MPLSITPISRANTSMVMMMNTPASLATGSATPTDSATPAPTATPRTVVSSADFALLPTLSGLDARVTLHGPFIFSLAPDPRAALVQDAPNVIRVTRPVTTYADDGSPQGIIQTEYVIQDPTARDSSPDPASVVRSGPVTLTLAPASSAEATGTREVAVTLDPAWLGDSRRVFPVTVDLPVVTADAAIHSGVFGTLSSCAPDAPAAQTALLVGVAGGCTYHGQVYFDLTALPAGSPIHSAHLWLYAPDGAGTPGVLVYPNAVDPNATGARDPAQPTTWRDAPALVPGTPGLASDGGAGHWQSWDVTSLVQGWVRDNTTNGGLTLVGAGDGLARFTSPLGAGGGDPNAVPYLDVAAGEAGTGSAGQRAAAVAPAIPVPPPVPTPPPFNSDGAPTIYGVSGGFTADGPTVLAGGAAVPVERDSTCYNYATGKNTNNISCGGQNGAIRVSAVTSKLNASFVRFNVNLACNEQITYTDSRGNVIASATRINPAAPGPAWWGSDNANPIRFNGGSHNNEPVYTLKGKYYIYSAIPLVKDPSTGKYIPDPRKGEVAADTQDRGGLPGMLTALARYRNRIIPIIDVTANGHCSYHSGPPNENTPSLWYSQVRNLVKYIHDQGATLPMVYFEIGNEVDAGYPKPRNSTYSDGRFWDGTDGTFHYEDVFAAAARGLNQALPQYGYRNYRIITAGMQAPSASLGKASDGVPYCAYAYNQHINPQYGAFPPQDNSDNVVAAGQAIKLAETGAPSYPPPSGQQGPSSSPPPVQVSHLGTAVHPYGYFTRQQNQWVNLYATQTTAHHPFAWGGPCLDLGDLFKTWTGKRTNTVRPYSETTGQPRYPSRYDGVSYNLQGLPLLFTEVNYEAGDTSQNIPAEGAYVAGLFTWLYNHRCLTSYQMRTCTSAPIDAGNDLLRVAIFNGVGSILGIYDNGGVSKPVGGGGLRSCATSNTNARLMAPSATIDRIYRSLLNDACYYYPTSRS